MTRHVSISIVVSNIYNGESENYWNWILVFLVGGGVDFIEPVSPYISVNSSSSPSCFTFGVVDDTVIEGSEQFDVTIIDAGRATIRIPSTSNIIIVDDDRKGVNG